MLINSLLKWFRIKKLDRHTSFFVGLAEPFSKYVSFTNRYSGLYLIVQAPPRIPVLNGSDISQVNNW